MRLDFGALPWDMLGRRPVMVTLTYPGEWEVWVPDARTFVRHREALKERWRRKFGTPVGVWVAEFQKRGAPHLHLYLGLPDSVSDDEYVALQRRTIDRRIAERKVGAYEARRQMRAPTGEFAMWLRSAWWEVVGSELKAHHGRGVDIAAAFFSVQAEETANRVRVAEYFWRESGKWAQKQPPEEFGSLKFYGRWGQKAGFNPVVTAAEMDERVGLELRRVMRRMMLGKMREAADRAGRRVSRNAGRSRGRDGLTVFNVDGTVVGPRLVEWAEEMAAKKTAWYENEARLDALRRGGLRALSELELAPDDGREQLDEGELPDELIVPEEAFVDAHMKAQALMDAEIDVQIERCKAAEMRERRKVQLRAADRWPGPRTERGQGGARRRP